MTPHRNRGPRTNTCRRATEDRRRGVLAAEVIRDDSIPTGTNAWFGHSPHLTLGFPQTPRTHSFAQAGEYPLRPCFAFSRRLGKTSSRPRNSVRNRRIFSSARSRSGHLGGHREAKLAAARFCENPAARSVPSRARAWAADCAPEPQIRPRPLRSRRQAPSRWAQRKHRGSSRRAREA